MRYKTTTHKRLMSKYFYSRKMDYFCIPMYVSTRKSSIYASKLNITKLRHCAMVGSAQFQPQIAAEIDSLRSSWPPYYFWYISTLKLRTTGSHVSNDAYNVHWTGKASLLQSRSLYSWTVFAFKGKKTKMEKTEKVVPHSAL